MISKSRPWANTVHLDDRWKPNGRLARHRPYFFYEDDEIAPCDRHGFRVPMGHASIDEKYRAADARAKAFCYGGSTTFGVYCAYEQAYPHQLEQISSHACFNMGLQTFDLYGSLLSFVDHLRRGLVPDIAIFLDGVNENQGYIQAVAENRADYVEEFRQYRGFRDIILNASLIHRLKAKFRGGDADLTAQAGAAGDPCRFAADQAAHYVSSMQLIQKLAVAHGIKTVFLLQPAVWDVWPESPGDPRFDYLKALYRNIVEASGESVFDISNAVPLSPEAYYDWAHLDAAGNATLARAIAAKVF